MTDTKDRIVSYISTTNDAVYIRDEFSSFGSVSQLSRALSSLIKEKAIVRVGIGLYAPSRLSKIDGSAVPIANMMKIGIVALKKLGIEVDIGTRYKDLYSGRSTQIPMIPIVNVGQSKTKRKIGYGPTKVHYERNQ
jgi:hypothetical protein